MGLIDRYRLSRDDRFSFHAAKYPKLHDALYVQMSFGDDDRCDWVIYS